MLSFAEKHVPSPINTIGAKTLITAERAAGRNYFEYSYGEYTFRFLYFDKETLVSHKNLIDEESGEFSVEGLPLSYLQPDREVDVVVDVEAHFGIYSVLMGVLNPEARILSYEPMPHPRNILKRHLELNNLMERATVSRKPVIGEVGYWSVLPTIPTRNPKEWILENVRRSSTGIESRMMRSMRIAPRSTEPGRRTVEE